jgi:hypothetical protein
VLQRETSCDFAERAEKMNLSSTFGLATSAVLCAALIACAGPGEPTTATVVRTPAPQKYESTITNYFAFRIRNPQKNSELTFGQPEPGACALDGYITGRRGWVVPVSYSTRTGEVAGKEPIRFNIKQYYFWFLGDTIAGITPRIELCPGLEATLIEGAPPSAAAGGLLPVAGPLATKPDARERVDAADASKRERPKGAAGQKPKTGQQAKKSGSASSDARKGTTKAGSSAVNPGRSSAAPPKPVGATSTPSPLSTDTK